MHSINKHFVYLLEHGNEEPRILGLAMIPGKHIVSLEVDEQPTSQADDTLSDTNDSPQTRELLPTS